MSVYDGGEGIICGVFMGYEGVGLDAYKCDM